MIYAAVAFWLVLGLIVFFVALRGGPAGARETLHAEGRSGRRVRLVLTVAAFAFGIGVPVAVAVTDAAHKAKRGPAGLTLTASAARGRTLFAHQCATCHTLASANAVGKVGPNLDQLRPPKTLVIDAIQNGRARGMGQMPALLLSGRDAQDVATFVATVAGR